MAQRMRVAFWALVGAIVLAFAGAGVAAAHANLVRSDPPANAVLDAPPPRLTLWFSEQPDPQFSEIQLLDTAGRRLDRGGVQVAPGDPLALTLPLDPLSPGVYTVSWKTLSAVDGHTTRGGFAFAIGRDQAAALRPATPAAPPDEWANVTPGAISARWFNLLSLAMLVGALGFPPLVLLRPAPGPGRQRARRQKGRPARSAEEDPIGWLGPLQLLIAVGLAATTLATLYAAWVQAASAAEVSLPRALGQPLADLLLRTRYGLLFWARLALLAALVVVLALRQRHGPSSVVAARASWWWTALALGGLVLLTMSVNSHAAAERDASVLSIGADWAHLAAAGIWFGGLVALLVTLPRLRADARTVARIVGNFSRVATVCVATLGLTGLYRGVVEIADVANLTDTAYGTVLLAKLALIVPLLGLAALNLLLIKRRLAAAAARLSVPESNTWLGRLRLSVGGEVACVSGVLLATALLTSLPPARDAFGSGVVVRSQADDLRVILVVSPGEAGLNTFTVILRDASGRPVDNAQKVALEFEHTTMNMGVSEAVATPIGNGRYQAQGGEVSMSGRWRAQVLVRRSGRDDARTDLTFDAAEPSGGPGGAPAPSMSLPVRLLFGLELLVAGAVLLLGMRRLRRASLWAGRVGLVVAAGLLGYGGYSTVQGFYTDVTPSFAMQNPIPADAASLERGRQVYVQHCAACHGDDGRGDGPAGLALNPPPADFRVHMRAGHTDGQLFWWVSNGFPGSAMPAWKDQLPEQERWDVINYIKTFGASPPAPPTAGPPAPATARATATPQALATTLPPAAVAQPTPAAPGTGG